MTASATGAAQTRECAQYSTAATSQSNVITGLPDTPLPFQDLCTILNDRLTYFLKEEPANERLRNVQVQTRVSLDVVSQALDRYSLNEISLAYNGGKDCLVLLILYLCSLHRKGLTAAIDTSPASESSIKSVYIQSLHPFPEVETFVASSVKTYNLSLAAYASPMKAAFSDYLRDFPSVKAIFVGTRRTDPHGANLTHFDPTDHGWPKFMRIHPVIDWHYAEIWAFIRHLRIPYCSLYDRGYTSLGGTTDTHPNPALRRKETNGNGELNGVTTAASGSFLPAYLLVEDEEERLGRDR